MIKFANRTLVNKVKFTENTKIGSLTFAGEKEFMALQKKVKEQSEIIKLQKGKIDELNEKIVEIQTKSHELLNQILEKDKLIYDQENKISNQSQKEHVLRLRDDLEIAHIIPRLRL